MRAPSVAAGGGGFTVGAFLQWLGSQYREGQEMSAMESAFLALLAAFETHMRTHGG